MRINLGLSSLLTLAFVIAKLAGVVKWSWWIVFCPTIISVCVALFLVASLVCLAGVVAYLQGL